MARNIDIQGYTYEYVNTKSVFGRKVHTLRQISGVGTGTVIEVRQWATRDDLWLAESNGCMMGCTLAIDPTTGKMTDITHRVNMGEMKSAPNPNYPGGVAFWYTKPTLDGVPVLQGAEAWPPGSVGPRDLFGEHGLGAYPSVPLLVAVDEQVGEGVWVTGTTDDVVLRPLEVLERPKPHSERRLGGRGDRHLCLEVGGGQDPVDAGRVRVDGHIAFGLGVPAESDEGAGDARGGEVGLTYVEGHVFSLTVRVMLPCLVVRVM